MNADLNYTSRKQWEKGVTVTEIAEWGQSTRGVSFSTAVLRAKSVLQRAKGLLHHEPIPLLGNCSCDYHFPLENTQVLGCVLPTFILSTPYGQRRHSLISSVSDAHPLSQEKEKR